MKKFSELPTTMATRRSERVTTTGRREEED